MSTDYMRCFGLDFLEENDEAFNGFLCYLLKNGKAVPSYADDHIDFRHKTGYPEFIMTASKAEEEEENELTLNGFYVHCSGLCKWRVRIDRTLINSPKEGIRQLLVRRADGQGMCIVNVAQPDVLPSYFIDEEIELQVIAFAHEINYYSDEEEYAENESYEVAENKFLNGKKMLNAVGSVLPIVFLNNHQPGREPDEDVDDLVSIAGKVYSVERGVVKLGEDLLQPFVDCFIETDFGNLEVVHFPDQVDSSQYEKIKVGSVVSGLFVISGDPLLGKYKDGAVYDEENILRYLGTAMSEEETSAENLRQFLADDCIYFSDVSGISIQGKDEIIDLIEKVKSLRKNQYYINMGTITDAAENSQYKDGKRCLLLHGDDYDKYESIVFADFDEQTKIKRIYICDDKSYSFLSDANYNRDED